LVTVAAGCLALMLVPWPPALGSSQLGRVIWSSRFDAVGRDDGATDVAVAPTGQVVFATGRSEVVDGASDYATLAYDAGTGRQLWESLFHGRAGGENAPAAMGTNGDRVFVTGQSLGFDRNPDFATVAYDATNGAQRWVRRVGPNQGEAAAMALVMSPDGARVFVTGWHFEYGLNVDFLTLAYDAATGAELWRATYAGPAEDDVPQAIGVSPDGSRVFVTGGSVNVNTNLNYATVAYDAEAGTELWVRRYAPGGLYSGATDLAVSPGGNRVYVTGFSPAPGTSNDYATLAYRASDGKRLWESRFDYAPEGYDKPHAIAAHPLGRLVFVTGESGHLGEQTDYLTLALDARTGAVAWMARLGGPAGGNDVARDIAASPTSGTVYVTGESWGADQPNYLTVAYDPETGSRDWLAPYGTPDGFDSASALALGVGALFVTGASESARRLDFATIAYQAD
jgi:hypothetical protein